MRCQPISDVFRIRRMDTDSLENYIYRGKFPEFTPTFGSSGRPVPGRYDLSKFKQNKLER